ncbi:MAG: EAL domain-containing protein [Oscillospiraceae bacterium]|jgi:EAL domain-containing protein (putative c-di-GMP-specific phosphodiesterase class I)|nr:EAL domain-containing protein [Oscillospiraceae bacterium]
MDLINIKSFRNRLYPLLGGFLLTVLVAVIVYFTGGTKNVYTNLMYIPIALIASIYGFKWGLLHAAISGFLVGPFMPLDVKFDTSQTPINWSIRILTFIVIAVIIGVFSDIAHKRELKVSFLITNDPDTGLKNYEALRSEKSVSEHPISFFSVAVTDYQEYLGFFGYDFFQQIIGVFSKELTETLLSFPNAEVYRYYGMEFAIKVTHDEDEPNTEGLLTALSTLNERTISVMGVPVYIEFRVGIATLASEEDPLDGIRRSLVALRSAVRNNQRLVRYTSNMEVLFKSSVNIANGFREALDRGNIRTAYQTIHDSGSGRTVGVELLARWIRDDDTRITPDVFVPVLEKTALIHDLTEFMFDRALHLSRNPEYKGMYISVNFSSSDFNERSILSLVQKAKEHEVNPSIIHIEITERVLLSVANIQSHLDFLHRHGFVIVIDDFGTGYSSYGYISDFPIDVIKIDRSLILRANTPRGFGLVQSIVTFCNKFNIVTVAEGVENKEFADICEELGISQQQGYFFSKPELLPIMPKL